MGVLCLLSPAQDVDRPSGITNAPDGWQAGAPRAGISPRFAFEPRGGPAAPALTIASSGFAQNGYWRKTFRVAPGEFYRFSACYRTDRVPLPRRSVLAEIVWQDDSGRIVPTIAGSTEPELPPQSAVRADGWTELSDVYRVPPQATRAQVDLVLRWASNAAVKWSRISFDRTEPPARRMVRLAAAYLRPQGSAGIAENLRLMEPLVEQAAAHKAGLIVFGELITVMGVQRPKPPAEPVPGPTTTLLGQMARRHNIYIVAGMPERDGPSLYNSAVLLGPDGKLIGKYRKMALTTAEARQGFTPGNDYPVFETRFGKLGIMICYDLFFPEVAQELARRGAEIIAVPIWGGDERLAPARALDNRVFIVTSAYEPLSAHWMRSGIWDPEGNLLTAAQHYGTVALAEIDLNKRFDHKWLGDFRNHIPRASPVVGSSETIE